MYKTGGHVGTSRVTLPGNGSLEQGAISKGRGLQSTPMLGVTHYRTGRSEEQKYYLWWPKTGGLKILLEVSLLSYLVVVATPVLTDQIAVMNPAIVPEPFTTIVHASLLIGVGGVTIWLFRSQSLIVMQAFDERDAVEKRLKHDVPDWRWLIRQGGLVVFGGALSWFTFERFLYTFVSVIDLFVIVLEEFQWTLTMIDGLYALGFLVGFVLFATGFDRLVIGGLRVVIRRQQKSA